MNKKLHTIKVLKDKLLNIQNHLQKIIRDEDTNILYNSNNHSLTPHSNQSINHRHFQNPTFWGGDPILGKDKQDRSKTKSQKKNIQPVVTNRPKPLKPISSQIKQIAQQSCLRYYSPSKPQKEIFYSLEKERDKRYNTGSKSPSSENRGETPRFQKIRTYKKEITNPILNPEPEKTQGIKIVKTIERSPDNYFTENPRSNNLLYFNNTQPIYLSPIKGNVNIKNQSSIMSQILSNNSSLQNLRQPAKKGLKGKKHFARYFHQNLYSKWV